MSTDAKKHTSFAAGETPTRAALAAAILSASDVVPASNATDQAQIVSALTGTAYPVGSTRPLTTTRGDAPALHQLEVSRDGLVFTPQSGVLHFASTAARNTWTSANGALLVAQDVCIVSGVEYRWSGTAWLGGTFTPTWSGLTVGNGSTTGNLRVVGNLLVVTLTVTFGSTSSMSGVVTCTNVPASMAAAQGAGIYSKPGVGDFQLLGDVINANTIRVSAINAGGSYAMRADLGSAITAANTDSMTVTVAGILT